MTRRNAIFSLLLGALAVAGCASPVSMMNGGEGAIAGADGKIVEIIEEYKRRFRQESVMWVREDVRVRF